jgi:ankyrin repeat protein
LHGAAREGAEQVCRSLLAARADLNSRDIEGKTPLFEAAQRNRFGTAKLLLEGGASPDIGDRHGLTPRRLAGAKTKPEWSELFAGVPIAELVPDVKR